MNMCCTTLWEAQTILPTPLRANGTKKGKGYVAWNFPLRGWNFGYLGGTHLLDLPGNFFSGMSLATGWNVTFFADSSRLSLLEHNLEFFGLTT